MAGTAKPSHPDQAEIFGDDYRPERLLNSGDVAIGRASSFTFLQLWCAQARNGRRDASCESPSWRAGVPDRANGRVPLQEHSLDRPAPPRSEHQVQEFGSRPEPGRGYSYSVARGSPADFRQRSPWFRRTKCSPASSMVLPAGHAPVRGLLQSGETRCLRQEPAIRSSSGRGGAGSASGKDVSRAISMESSGKQTSG